MKTNKLKKILVVDDDPGILDAIQLMLEDEGYTVEVSDDGSKVKAVTENQPDLILLDIWMSGVNGSDICVFLKQHTETKDIPVIMVSANQDTPKISEDCGADDYIVKPFDMDELLNKVKKYTSH